MGHRWREWATCRFAWPSVAYKLAMPRMESLNAIRAAIACIAQGIALEVFDGRDGSQLLYAAQVAMSTLKAKGGKKK